MAALKVFTSIEMKHERRSRRPVGALGVGIKFRLRPQGAFRLVGDNRLQEPFVRPVDELQRLYAGANT